MLRRELVGQSEVEGLDDGVRLHPQLPDLFAEVLGELLEQALLLLLHKESEEVGGHVALKKQLGPTDVLHGVFAHLNIFLVINTSSDIKK